ncbi:MAG: redox-sensing transcriptional repressor Rex [Spirochaetales bacterium]|nr:redox-sensing transcriptional repressor Rex [Spirochaetales bacterium]
MSDDSIKTKDKIAPLPTIRRIPSYLRLLYEYRKEGREWISATDIAERLSLKPIQVRKDMAFTGITGKPKKGFVVSDLIDSIRGFLGWDMMSDTVIVGSGALGSALIGYSGFSEHGLNIIGAFDNDEAKIGSLIHGHKVYDLKDIASVIKDNDVTIGIITVPAQAAQSVADKLVEAGIKGIWNFSPVKLRVPECVIVEKEDLSSGLAVLSVKLGAHLCTD